MLCSEPHLKCGDTKWGDNRLPADTLQIRLNLHQTLLRVTSRQTTVSTDSHVPVAVLEGPALALRGKVLEDRAAQVHHRLPHNRLVPARCNPGHT